MLILHVIAGTLVLFFGSVALFSSKGFHLHRIAGKLFFISMLILSVSAMYLAVTLENEFPFIPILILYLVATSWMTVKRIERKITRFDYAACLIIIIIAIGMIVVGLDPANGKGGTNESGIYFFFGGVAALAGLLDINMILRGGISGSHRIARHLWRMCFALTGAIASFIAQEEVIPKFLVDSDLLWLPIISMLILMIFWLIRVLFTKWISNKNMFKISFTKT